MSMAGVSVFMMNDSPSKSRCCRSSFARPVVTSFLQLESELFTPASDDSPRYHHMDVIGDDVIEDPLVVRNQQYAQVGGPQRIFPGGHGSEGVDGPAGGRLGQQR